MLDRKSWKKDVRETVLERGCKRKELEKVCKTERVGKKLSGKQCWKEDVREKSWKEGVRQKELGKSCQENSVGKRM